MLFRSHEEKDDPPEAAMRKPAHGPIVAAAVPRGIGQISAEAIMLAPQVDGLPADHDELDVRFEKAAINFAQIASRPPAHLLRR